RRQLPLRERAEAAAEVADVRVLDVPRDDVSDRVAVHLAPEAVGVRADALPLLPARAKQPHDLVLRELVTCTTRKGVAAEDERDGTRLARRPLVLPREAE